VNEKKTNVRNELSHVNTVLSKTDP